MTETDAAAIALLDIDEAIVRMQRCASPTEMVTVTSQFVAHRAKGLGLDPTTIPDKDDERQSLSVRVAELGRQSLVQCVRVLGPEDARAMLVWALGLERIGFLPALLEGLPPDQDKERAVEILSSVGRKLLEILDRRDQDLFQKKLPALSAAQRRIVQGYLEEARIAAGDNDGETARHKSQCARKAIVRFHADDIAQGEVSPG